VPQIKRAWRADPATNDYNLSKSKKTVVEAVQELESPMASNGVSVNWHRNKRKVRLITSVIATSFLLAVSILFAMVYIRTLNNDGIDPFEKALSLDMDDLIYLDDKPETYQVGSQYNKFEQIVPRDFAAKGNLKLTNIQAWYDDYNIEGMQFTFSNGLEQYKTKLFGLNVDRRGIEVKSAEIEVKEPIKSVSRLMVNTKTSA